MDAQLVREMLGLPDMLDVPSALVIEPHPDDNEVGAGATVKLLRERNVRVIYLTVTDGGAGSEDSRQSSEELVRLRRTERQRASSLLGVEESYNLDFEDGGTWSEHQLMMTLVPLIRQFQPTLVMTVDPWTPYESHPDHIKTGKAVAAALIYSKNGVVARGQGAPFEVPLVAFYGSAYPNRFVEVTTTWQIKLEAMKAHASQFDTPSWPLVSEFLTAEAKRLFHEHCDPNRVGYAESFKVLASMQLHFFPEAVRS